VFRTGRFDAKIYVGLPDLAARRGILERNLTAGQREPDLDLDSWADRLDGYTGSDIVGIIAAAKRSVLGRCVKGGGNDQVSENDLLQAVESIPASVTPKLLEKYRRFREQRFR
jgi:SpoVK/Ycf46/Vps4 family AAA+-type ATPase